MGGATGSPRFAGRITPGPGYSGTVTYHHPCYLYLGRHNRIFDQPRSVIDAIPGVKPVEMRHCRERGFCCGAGGARMWMEESIGTRIDVDRTEEAFSTDADVMATACPYCMIMLDDAVFDLIAATTGQPCQWVVPAGTVD